MNYWKEILLKNERQNLETISKSFYHKIHKCLSMEPVTIQPSSS